MLIMVDLQFYHKIIYQISIFSILSNHLDFEVLCFPIYSQMIVQVQIYNINQMQKEKDKRMKKRDALKNFLQSSTTPSNSEVSKSEVSRQENRLNNEPTEQCQEVFLDDNNCCVICQKELDIAKIKKCGFCNMPGCSDHLRKRRRKKGKFQRICDNCEDNVIYEIYTKLEAKAEESINVEEEIITMKHDDFMKEVEQRRQKRREIGFKTMALQKRYEQENVRLTNEENKLMSVQHQVESLELSVVQLSAFVTRVETSFKQNNEQDFNILSEENARLAKELAKIEKKCLEIRSLMEKKEKDIEEAFSSWQQRQFKKKLQSQQREATAKKKDNCSIY